MSQIPHTCKLETEREAKDMTSTKDKEKFLTHVSRACHTEGQSKYDEHERYQNRWWTTKLLKITFWTTCTLNLLLTLKSSNATNPSDLFLTLLVQPSNHSNARDCLHSYLVGCHTTALKAHYMCLALVYFIEGSLNSKLPTIWTLEKQSRVVKSAETRCNSAKVRRKKIHPRQLLEKSRHAVFF